jgi:hypothetical protein
MIYDVSYNVLLYLLLDLTYSVSCSQTRFKIHHTRCGTKAYTGNLLTSLPCYYSYSRTTPRKETGQTDQTQTARLHHDAVPCSYGQSLVPGNFDELPQKTVNPLVYPFCLSGRLPSSSPPSSISSSAVACCRLCIL